MSESFDIAVLAEEIADIISREVHKACEPIVVENRRLAAEVDSLTAQVFELQDQATNPRRAQ